MPRFFNKLLPPHLRQRRPPVKKKEESAPFLMFSKRQKFVLAVFVLSLGLFTSEYLFSGYGVAVAGLLAVLTDVFLLGALYEDLGENFSIHPFVLPFLCSLAFGLFYFLTPSRLLSRIVLTTLYAVGLYSVFLSENIFVVASIRTIALLNSARIVTFVITLIAYFFLTNTIFSFRLPFYVTIGLFAIFTFLFTFHSVWTYTLERGITKNFSWNGIVTLSLVEVASILWFWPTVPTVFALFMTAMFYILTGLVHVWLEKRLFRNVVAEYVWVAIVALFILIWFSSWQ
ncbi:MAG TPA: hypothetical protein VF189_04360 [Patescibacteria group bacterium]